MPSRLQSWRPIIAPGHISDLLRAAENRRLTLLGVVDLSAAFDCVDHDILLWRLNAPFGIDGTALQWIN